MKLSVGKRYSTILAFSILIVSASLYLPKTFYSDNDLANISCGWPLPFVQGNSNFNPPFPWQASCRGMFNIPWENTSSFLWFPFILNVGIVFMSLNGIFRLFIFAKKKVKT